MTFEEAYEKYQEELFEAATHKSGPGPEPTIDLDIIDCENTDCDTCRACWPEHVRNPRFETCKSCKQIECDPACYDALQQSMDWHETCQMLEDETWARVFPQALAINLIYPFYDECVDQIISGLYELL